MKTARDKLIDLSLLPSEVARRVSHLPGCIFLDSSDITTDTSRLSIIAAEPVATHSGSLAKDTPLLRAIISKHQQGNLADYGYPLGGLFGYVDYDGQFLFGEYDSLLVYHHHTETWRVVGEPNYLDKLRGTQHSENLPHRSLAPLTFQAEMTREQFIARVRLAQDWIAAGDIYQVNLAYRFHAERPKQAVPFAHYERLRNISPAPYSAFLNLGGRQILSSSPECFLKMSGRGITTKPIKGTRPRFADPLLDEQSAYDLITSSKEVSELVMITDLERNDLGRICEYGSVEVRDLLALERFAQVFHLVSTVTGRLHPDLDQLDALRLSFPGGSITGAPKKRAMEIIHSLEPSPRGLYTGTIGYLGWNGESQFNIAIRTLIAEPNHWHFHVGAGIVADSDPAAEYDETLHKAAGILRA